MSAVCRVRRLPSLYQAMAGGGTARLVTWWIGGLLQFNFNVKGSQKNIWVPSGVGCHNNVKKE